MPREPRLPSPGSNISLDIPFHRTLSPRAERVPHLSLDTAVGALTSASFPRRRDGNWVFALSPRADLYPYLRLDTGAPSDARLKPRRGELTQPGHRPGSKGLSRWGSQALKGRDQSADQAWDGCLRGPAMIFRPFRAFCQKGTDSRTQVVGRAVLARPFGAHLPSIALAPPVSSKKCGTRSAPRERAVSLTSTPPRNDSPLPEERMPDGGGRARGVFPFQEAVNLIQHTNSSKAGFGVLSNNTLAACTRSPLFVYLGIAKDAGIAACGSCHERLFAEL
jgi:hypothetical protein